jgi:hypothetical protein
VEAIKIQIAALVDESNRLKGQVDLTLFDHSDSLIRPKHWTKGAYEDTLVDDLVKLEELNAEIARQ